MQAVRPQLLAQDPNRRLSAGQVLAYLYIWSLDRLVLVVATAYGAVRPPGSLY